VSSPTVADPELRERVFTLLRERVAGDQVDDVDVRAAVLDLIDLVRAHPVIRGPITPGDAMVPRGNRRFRR
jgi:hypothetical protein